jgi:phage tail-like protein
MPNDQLITTFQFQLSISGVGEVARFTHCSGLEIYVEVHEFQEGGNNDSIHYLPGRVRYPHLVLTGGMTKNEVLLKWLQSGERKQITLTLGSGNDSRTWTFANAFPVRWRGPQLAAGSPEVASETLEIAHSGLELP